MSLKVFVWNVREWRTKDAEIIRRSIDCDILFITETKSKRNDRLVIPSFDTYVRNNYRQGERGVGGIAILEIKLGDMY